MDELLRRLRALTEQNQYEEGISLCDDALASTEGADRARLWRLRSYVHQQSGHHDRALEDIATGLTEQPTELSLLFERATIYVELQSFAEANADLERLRDIERRRGDAFFDGAARILQAICLNKLGRPSEALNVSTPLSRDVRTWALGRLWTPDELESESRARLKKP